MHYYQHSIGDYRRDTMHLSLLEHGIYRQLLDLYYLNECELNANALRLICARSAEEVRAAESVLNEFFERTENGYKHKRCDAEIERFHNKSKKAKASADARWSAKQDDKDANAMRTHSEGNANHKPITNNHKPLTNIKTKTKTTAKATLSLPDFIPNEVWESFKAMRVRIRKPMTMEAERLLVKDLVKIKDDGFDPVEAINNSIKNSWQGIFVPKSNVSAFPRQKSKMDISGIDYKQGVNADGSF